jgi:hypothetical protein
VVDGRGALVIALTALVQSALCAGLMRAAWARAVADPRYIEEGRTLAAWSRAYARTAGLHVPVPEPRRQECDS